ncbi:undecaprenyl-phosphate glucose phosphotransferase [Fimbriiglobus ruber]|uniref:Sugar transferase n=1 Tax=Fimbriiglobus ruber TaxID=1908690 RepID=A0A225E4F9_9BACT|nr:undecaprenyl-phosphate glucose phosphotransferase [Fimbriiglobus ruber]OWK43575.1 sugar transferase [Fimbriiglobus ruber]
MVKRSSQPLSVWFMVWDVVVTSAAWVGAYMVRFDTGIPLVNNHQPDFELCVRNLPLICILCLVSYRVTRMYEIHRMRRFREEMVAVGKGVALLSLLVMSTNFARQYPYESRLAMVLFGVLTFAGVLACRRVSWSVLGRLRSRGYNQSHALIVGTGRLARRTARSLENASWMGIQTVAYVDDQHGQTHFDHPVLGPIVDLPKFVYEQHIEHVFIALPLNRYSDARRVFDVLSQTLVDVRLVADVPALTALSLTTSTLHGMTFIGLRESPYHGLNLVVKRIMDIGLSLFAIALFAPFMAAIAALIKVTSTGPILYRQERCSLNGKSFSMLKFRTMCVNAEVAGPAMTAQKDPRRTRLGSILRTTNLDELPQFFNVLRGDMSLVGPRPERPYYVNKFRKTIPNYMARHAVKCGITGWAQVNGWRGNSSLRKRVQYDLYYITHWNPMFDLRIIVLTAWKMIFGRQRHAY